MPTYLLAATFLGVKVSQQYPPLPIIFYYFPISLGANAGLADPTTF
jgi:hypothetical protein